MRMARHFIGIGFCMIIMVVPGNTQQLPQYTHYLFNHFGIHPAIAGTRPCVEMRLGYRSQWLNFPGAPKTAFANVHGRIMRKKMGFVRNIHGVGMNVESDQMGPFGITRLQFAYAYHVPMNRTMYFSAGLFAGFEQWRVDANKITLLDYSDPAVGGGSRFVLPVISPGIWMYSNTFYAGLTMKQMFKNSIKVMPDSKLRQHYILTGGKKIEVGKNNKALIPSVALKWAAVSAPAIDLNLLFAIDDRYVIGASYRNTDAVALIARINFLRNFSLGYSFDFTTSKLKNASSNTHEIILGIHTCKPDKRNSIECPVFQ
jgi:type IX secretion system PorP/SprF family membrane protein